MKTPQHQQRRRVLDNYELFGQRFREDLRPKKNVEMMIKSTAVMSLAMPPPHQDVCWCWTLRIWRMWRFEMYAYIYIYIYIWARLPVSQPPGGVRAFTTISTISTISTIATTIVTPTTPTTPRAPPTTTNAAATTAAAAAAAAAATTTTTTILLYTMSIFTSTSTSTSTFKPNYVCTHVCPHHRPQGGEDTLEGGRGGPVKPGSYIYIYIYVYICFSNDISFSKSTSEL